MTPFFTEGDFFISPIIDAKPDCSHYDAQEYANEVVRLANVKVAPLLEENEKLKAIFLTTEHGNEFEMVRLLKEENERLKKQVGDSRIYSQGLADRIAKLEEVLRVCLVEPEEFNEWAEAKQFRLCQEKARTALEEKK